MSTTGSTLFELGFPNRRTLQMVIVLHLLESLAQAALLLFCVLVEMPLPYGALSAIAVVYGVWNVGSWFSARGIDENSDCTRALILQLVIEVLVLAALLYFGGGASNPFVSLFLVPLAMASITLLAAPAIAIGLLAAACYTLLLWFFQPLASQAHVHGASAFSMHVIGMWVNFLASGVLLVGFLLRLSAVARERAERLAVLRESRLRDQQLVAMAGVAAGAAHSLATPLSTIGVALDELHESGGEDREIVAMAREQLEVCRERLSEILQATRAGQAGALVGQLPELVSSSARRWHLLRPEADLRVQLDLPAIEVALDPAIGHGLSTVLDNAIDAGLEAGDPHVMLQAGMTGELLELAVEDHGGGPPPDLGRLPTTSSKRHGAGAGLMILRANLERLGGELLFAAGDRGTIARIRVPVREAVNT